MDWCIIPGMANSPARTTRSSDDTEPYRPRKIERIIADHLIEGGNPTALAKQLEEKYGQRPWRSWRARIMRTIAGSQWIQQQLHMAGQAELAAAIPGTTAGVGRRGRRGRTDSAKLIFEATGFHNPKVKHEHSGDVTISLNMPRPTPVETIDATYEDADVVE